jgi:taurine---2-oxoglutarate transaminase
MTQICESISDLDRKHVFHAWAQATIQDPIVIADAKGSFFWDEEGRRYLDFSSQSVNVNLGHQHPAVISAICEQASRLCTADPRFSADVRSRAAQLIAEVTPGDLDKIFFTNGGADAIEHAVRMARLHTGRHKILSAYRSYHGATATAINLTGDPRRWPSDQASAGVVHFWGPYTYRSSFYADNDQSESYRALEHLERTIVFEGASTVAAVLLESVVGTAGVLVPPEGYLAGVRELCNKYGLLLILDEVMSGFGRTGKWFAADHWNVVPDLMTFAKGVNSGYLPLGGVAVGDRVKETFAFKPYPGGLTHAGHLLSCAAAVATLNVMEEEGVVRNAAEIGTDVLGPSLNRLWEKHPSVGDIRGLGVFWMVELVRDRDSREPLVPYNASGEDARAMVEVVAECTNRGLWVISNMNRIMIAPPCTVTAAEVIDGIDILDSALLIADGYCG